MLPSRFKPVQVVGGIATLLAAILVFGAIGRVARGGILASRLDDVKTAWARLDRAAKGGDAAELDAARGSALSSVSKLAAYGDDGDVHRLIDAADNLLIRSDSGMHEGWPVGSTEATRGVGSPSDALPAIPLLEAEIQSRLRNASEVCLQEIKILVPLCLLTCALTALGLSFQPFGRKVKVQTASLDERRFRSLIQNTVDVIAVASPDAVLGMVSESAVRVWGRSPSSLEGTSMLGYVHPNDREGLTRAIERTLAGLPNVKVEIRVLGTTKIYRPFMVHIADLTEDPNLRGLLLTFHDLSESKALERELIYRGSHDRLTDLANRELFMERLTQRQAAEGRSDAYAVLFIDLDNFKVINDSLGHAAGDQLLTEVAKRLHRLGRPVDTVARLGGDEFAILLDSTTSTDAMAYAERLKTALLAPTHIANREVLVTASMGIAMGDDGSSKADELLGHADTAMYHAKAKGKGRHALFTPSMNESVTERLELELDLRQALARKELVVYYQPIVALETGMACGVEALVRWNHPTRGLIAPSRFIPIAEETSLICEIGHWVLLESCCQLAQWRKESREAHHIGMNINVSGRQFQQPDFVRQVDDILRKTGVDPRSLTLEVTETAMIEDLDRMGTILGQLREIGIQIAIDDFGTGYSSISYLCRLPVDTLKIDRSFVASLGIDARADGLVQAVIAMGKTLALRVTCEGIETLEQLNLLRSYGGDSGQGYFFARPQAAHLIGELLSCGFARVNQRMAV